MIDPALRDDPLPYYEQLRARGPARWSPASRSTTGGPRGVHGRAAQPRLRHRRRCSQRLPPPVRLAMRLAAGRPARPGRAAVDAGRRPARPHPLPQARHPRVQRAGRRRAAQARGGDRRRAARRDGREGRRDRHRRPRRRLRQPAPRHRHRRDARRAGRDAPAVPAVGRRSGAVARPGPDLPRLPPRRARPARAAALDGRPLRPDPPLPRRRHPLGARRGARRGSRRLYRRRADRASRCCCSPPASRPR